MTDELNAPIDPVHIGAIKNRTIVSTWVEDRLRYVAAWEPAPMPEGWGREEHPAAAEARRRRGHR